jgi:two-component system nitrogen regulation response regulator GlnG
MDYKKILVVDDDPAFCEALKDVIETKDYQVSVAYCYSEAQEVLERERPDAVLLDVKMPDVGGLDALRRIKAIDPKAIVIMVTALHDDETGIEALRRGADGFITKPVDIDFLWDVLTSRVDFSTAL